jgi:hypothetical protein
METSNNCDVPLLEWVDADSEEEKFTLDQSKKKMKKVRASLGSSEYESPIRRSSRTTPSVYRQIGRAGKLCSQKVS